MGESIKAQTEKQGKTELKTKIVSGNEALALGALRAGVKVVSGYPGTPSSGVISSLINMQLDDRYVEWSTNEKVAFEIAAGAAWAGQRALCTMKMSGLNVAYDSLISIAYSGVNGGLVVYVADDPGVSAGIGVIASGVVRSYIGEAFDVVGKFAVNRIPGDGRLRPGRHQGCRHYNCRICRGRQP